MAKKKIVGKSKRREKALMFMAKGDAKAAERAIKGKKFFALITCDTDTCPNVSQTVNAIIGMKTSDELDDFIEGWDPGDDEEDVCIVCNEPGLVEGFGPED